MIIKLFPFKIYRNKLGKTLCLLATFFKILSLRNCEPRFNRNVYQNSISGIHTYFSLSSINKLLMLGLYFIFIYYLFNVDIKTEYIFLIYQKNS